MKKTVYIAPAINVVKINAENGFALNATSTAANQDYGMEVKEDRGEWGDEW